MRTLASRRLNLLGVAAALICSVATDGIFAQEIDIQPQKTDRPAGSENRTGDDNRDQEPQTVQTQLQAVKREQRTAKVEPGNEAPIRDGDHQFALRVPNYIRLRQRNIVMQQRDFSCGAACLATICRYYWGDDVTENMVLAELDRLLNMKETIDRIENGLAMSDLRRAAVQMGYQSVVGKTTYAKLTESKVPVIVGIEPSGHKHFVVYRGSDDYYVYMADPIRGNVRMPAWEFVKQWQENAILVVHKPGEKVKDSSPLSLTDADTRLGELNDHIIQTLPSRQPQYKQTIPP